MSGYVGDLSESQELALNELKQRVNDYVEKRVAEGWTLSEQQKSELK